MPTETVASRLSRREFGIAVSALIASLAVAKAQDEQPLASFLYSRSGKISHSSTDGVFLAGLLIENAEMQSLDQWLAQEATLSPLTRPLRYSTSPHDARFLSAALRALSDKTIFLGLRILAPQWAATPETFEYWRMQVEGAALKALTSSEAVTVYSLKHDWELDTRIYAALEASTPSSRSFILYHSEKESSRVFQLSNVISKCIGNKMHLNDDEVSEHKKTQISSVLSHYNLSVDDWSLQRPEIRLITLEVG